LSEGDVRLPKLFRQTVPQRWPGGGKTAVTGHRTGCVISCRRQKTAASGGNQPTTGKKSAPQTDIVEIAAVRSHIGLSNLSEGGATNSNLTV